MEASLPHRRRLLGRQVYNDQAVDAGRGGIAHE